MKRKRVIGTTPEAIRQEETLLGRVLPPDYVSWLLENNGRHGVDGIHIYSVKDDRDVAHTWDSLARNFEVGWVAWLETFEYHGVDFEGLLPFADFGTGDYYCFDYRKVADTGEPIIVHWSHESGATSYRARGFAEFVQKAEAGEFVYD